MKCIASEDLKLLLEHLCIDKLFSDTADTIFDLYGDDWFIVDGQWAKTKENEKMKELREEMMD